MDASWTCRVRRLLRLLAIFCGLAALPSSVWAVIPAGTMPMTQPSASSVPNPPPPLPLPPHFGGSGGVAPTSGGFGHISGGGSPLPQSNPEPASWILAVIGSALLVLAQRVFLGAFPGG